MKVLKRIFIFCLILIVFLCCIFFIVDRYNAQKAESQFYTYIKETQEAKRNYEEIGYEFTNINNKEIDYSEIVSLDNTVISINDFLLEYSEYSLSLFIEIPEVIKEDEFHIWYLDKNTSTILKNSSDYSKIYLNNGLILDDKAEIKYDNESNKYLLNGYYKTFIDVDVPFYLLYRNYDMINKTDNYKIHLIWEYDNVVGVLFEIIK